MKITDLPELSVADLTENDVVAVDHDTGGNGIETRKFRVGKALINKLDKSGGDMSGYAAFGKSGTGVSWACSNGDTYCLRPDVSKNYMQLTRQNANGIQEYGVLNIDANGDVTVYAPGKLGVQLLTGIVAYGDNYVRFGNGLQMCWGYVTNMTPGTAIQYPVAYAEEPKISATLVNSDAVAGSTPVIWINSVTSTNVVLGGNVSSIYATWMSFGKWK